ncbi:aldo/keto reductase [Alphaproteobacteria bacterium KMM 3653]|uniref:Aldo/keto reductase n=1 Tax=Harenicola maris TaxID=2841044 RepID=A0AAP2CU54_9RHOB|nr:aldo/keto reductase [Harenicola maris]
MSDMPYTRLGNSGLLVSRLALGTMTFTLGSDFIPGVAKTGQDEATRMVHAALDKGINFFDSADGYSQGDAEKALGTALKGRRQDAVICTKIGFRQSERMTDSGLSRGHITTSVEGCLTRLDTDVIDLLVLHKTDFTTPLIETLRSLDDLIRAGKIRYVGVSNWPAWMVAQAIEIQRSEGFSPFIAGQYLYNALHRDIETDVLRMGAQMGLGLMAWSPLAAGMLTGKYDPMATDKSEGRLNGGDDFLQSDPARAAQAIEALTEIGAAQSKTPAQIALAWILHQRRDHTVIIGASKASHLETSAQAAEITLTGDDLARLDAIAPPARRYPEWFSDMMTDEAHRAALS